MAHSNVESSESRHISRKTVIDLFSGCGGMSLGFKQAGFEILLAVDLDRRANQVYAGNIGLTPLTRNVFEMSSEEILREAGIRRGELDVLTGCPPCQGFTFLRSRNKEYATNALVAKMAELAVGIEPGYVVFENVSGILRMGEPEFSEYQKILEDGGYSTKYSVLNAVDYGVPQFRKRVIAISAKESECSRPLSFPSPTHCNPEEAEGSELNPWVTVRQVISDLPPLTNGATHGADPDHRSSKNGERVLDIIKAVPKNGGSRRDIPEELWLDCHKSLDSGAENVYGRMRWDEPSCTISSRCNVPACGRFIHPEQNRGMSIREALRLQTFPDEFQLDVGISRAARFVGNAMPVLLAKRIAEHIFCLMDA